MGPLAGIEVVEFAGLGPGPFCGMMLSDMGARVTRVDRPRGVSPLLPLVDDALTRGRTHIELDLKRQPDAERAWDLIRSSDVLIEGFRPGVMDRLGFGPETCLQENPRLIYGRMTGWGQTGPLAPTAGHDINYLALSGALHAIGHADRPPPPPLNLIADFGGGGMLLAFGIAAALYERERSGHGQVVDAAMVDGVALLTAMHQSLRIAGLWSDAREANLLDGGAPFYTTYETADDRYVAVGALEPQFYAELLRGLRIDPTDLPDQMDRDRWPELQTRLAATFRTRPLAEWVDVFAGTDACVSPVLTLAEASTHPHAIARATYVDELPAPAPRFSRTPPDGVPAGGDPSSQ